MSQVKVVFICLLFIGSAFSFFSSYDQLNEEGLVSTAGALLGTVNYWYTSDFTLETSTFLDGRASTIIWDPRGRMWRFYLFGFAGVRSKARITFETCLRCEVDGVKIPTDQNLYLEQLGRNVTYFIGPHVNTLDSFIHVNTTPILFDEQRRQEYFPIYGYGLTFKNLRVLAIPDRSRPYFKECDGLNVTCYGGFLDPFSQMQFREWIYLIPFNPNPLIINNEVAFQYYTVAATPSRLNYNSLL